MILTSIAPADLYSPHAPATPAAGWFLAIFTTQPSLFQGIAPNDDGGRLPPISVTPAVRALVPVTFPRSGVVRVPRLSLHSFPDATGLAARQRYQAALVDQTGRAWPLPDFAAFTLQTRQLSLTWADILADSQRLTASAPPATAGAALNPQATPPVSLPAVVTLAADRTQQQSAYLRVFADDGAGPYLAYNAQLDRWETCNAAGNIVPLIGGAGNGFDFLPSMETQTTNLEALADYLDTQK